MYAAEKPANPFALIAVAQFRPSSAAPGKHGVAKAMMYMHGLARAQQWRDHRNFLGRELAREGMFLADRGVAPALRAVELVNDRVAFPVADFIPPVFVVFALQHPPIAAKSQCIDRIQIGV